MMGCKTLVHSRTHWQVHGHAYHHIDQHSLLLLQAPCQHNFCLACFKRWVAQGKKSCPTCRHSFPAKFASTPRINTALTVAIRMAKQGVRKPTAAQQERIRDKDRPDEAFTTDRCMLVLLPALFGLRAVGADPLHNPMGLQLSCHCGAFCVILAQQMCLSFWLPLCCCPLPDRIC